ncbi:MAG TPA: phospholipase [Solirubrobacteraceae bacterium]|nr:phospholipase [Solirubrobacteraceae bacterium]
MSLLYRERPPRGEPEGLLVLHHGRGADENDLHALADVLDPEQHLYVVSPRAPLTPAGASGFHWYLVPRVGYPDPETFRAAFEALGELHDDLWQRTGIGPERTVLGGFSMGAVMSYALGLAAERPLIAGIMAFSGFIPTVAGWAPALEAHHELRVFVSHGERDQVIGVELARRAVSELGDGGLEVEYHESPTAHHIDPRSVPDAGAWLKATLEPHAGGA